MPSSSTGSDGSSAATTGGGGGAAGAGMKKGPWTSAEDAVLIEYVRTHGDGNWNAVQRNTGLMRCGKSCRLRWANHLRPNLKKGSFSPEEERLVLELHAKLGNKWARMASALPGRTDNEIKNYWNTRTKRRLRAGLQIYPDGIQCQVAAASRCNAPEPDNKTHLDNPPSMPPGTHHVFGYAAVPTATGMMPVPISMKRPGPVHLCGGVLADSQALFSNSGIEHQHRLKRTRTDGRGFASAGPVHAASPVPSSSPPLPLIPFIPGNYDSSSFPLALLQQARLRQQQKQNFSIQMELPSSQLFSAPADTELFGRSSKGTLEALFEEAWGKGIGGRGRGDYDLPSDSILLVEPKTDSDNWVGNGSSGGRGGGETAPILKAASPCDNTSSISTEHKLKNEPVDEFKYIDDDITGLFDDIQPAPVQSVPTAAPPGLYEYKEKDMSHEHSSIEDDLELPLDMQQLISSLSAEDLPMSVESCHWNNMTGIC